MYRSIARRALGFLRRHGKDLLFLLVVFLGRASFADHYVVPSGSMEPTLHVGDHLIVSKAAYGVRLPLTHTWLTESEPVRGDVVVFANPQSEIVMVKRVIGLPGDVLAFDGHALTINGQRVEWECRGGRCAEALPGAPHPLFPSEGQGPAFGPMRIPPDQYFMMGDHRGNSADSRYWGLVPHDHLLGRAMFLVYTDRPELPFGERWWVPLSHDRLDDRLQR